LKGGFVTNELTSLRVGKIGVRNIFELIGNNEDSISLAISWGLKCCPQLLRAVLKATVGEAVSGDRVTIAVHRHEAAGGITDIELESPGLFHVIIEAKKGWVLPSIAQLEMYARRATFTGSSARIKRLVTMSECSPSYTTQFYAGQKVGGHSLCHLSWRSLAQMCANAMSHSTHAEKRILQSLREYLENAMSAQSHDSNLVYVVSLGSGTPEGWQTSWIDVIAKYKRYFHPLSGKWPKSPPNYMGFRYGGILQSIHHVEKYEVVNSLHGACPGIPKESCEPHFLYHLGEPIRPANTVKNGTVWPSGRYWCALDTLLTCKTVSQARDLTDKRRGAVAL
jgi:hypothetical protein